MQILLELLETLVHLENLELLWDLVLLLYLQQKQCILQRIKKPRKWILTSSDNHTQH